MLRSDHRHRDLVMLKPALEKGRVGGGWWQLEVLSLLLNKTF